MSNILGIQEQSWEIFLSGGTILYLLQWTATDVNNQPAVDQAIQIGTPQDPTASTPIFPDVATALSYYRSTMCSSLLSDINGGNANNYFSSYTVSDLTPEVEEAFEALAAVANTGNASDLNDYSTLVNTTSLSSTLSGYVTSSSLTSALAAKQNALTSGSPTQYLRGDLSLANFPSIPAAQVNADWSAGSGVAQVLNKPSLSAVATSGSYGDLNNKPSIPTLYKLNSGSAPSLRSNPVEVIASGTVSSGSVVFQLTADGTSTGTALFPNNIDFMIASVSSTTAQYGFSYTLSNSNKTLTVGVSAITSALGILGLATAANGASINLVVKGN